MSTRPVHRPDPGPLQTDDARVVLVGTAGWALALAVLAVLRFADVGEVRDWWFGMCAYGIALGAYGVYACRRRDRAIARDAAAGIPRRS